MLDIAPSCNIVHYQGKLMKRTWKNDQKINFGLILVYLAKIAPGFTSTSS